MDLYPYKGEVRGESILTAFVPFRANFALILGELLPPPRCEDYRGASVRAACYSQGCRRSTFIFCTQTSKALQMQAVGKEGERQNNCQLKACFLRRRKSQAQ